MLKRFHIEQLNAKLTEDRELWLIKDQEQDDVVVERWATRKQARHAVQAWNTGQRKSA